MYAQSYARITQAPVMSTSVYRMKKRHAYKKRTMSVCKQPYMYLGIFLRVLRPLPSCTLPEFPCALPLLSCALPELPCALPDLISALPELNFFFFTYIIAVFVFYRQLIFRFSSIAHKIVPRSSYVRVLDCAQILVVHA